MDWETLTSFENLYFAWCKAARGKRGKTSVAEFEVGLEENLLQIQQEPLQKTYLPGEYQNFTIHDPKKRLISAGKFRDRVVHHALCNLIEPLFERKLIYDTYANRVGKGTNKALDRCTQYLRRFKYVLPLDVVQYFPNIDHQILFEKLSRVIADEQILWLCRIILDGGAGIHAERQEILWFYGDTLLEAYRPKGLPIGNLTSQFWANVYLNDLDHFIKRDLKCKGYIRYVDDLLLFGDEKEELWSWRQAVIKMMAAHRLKVHEKSAQIRPCRVGIPFLGFQVFPDHRRVKSRKVIHARRRLKSRFYQMRQGEISKEKFLAGLQGWAAHVSHADTWGLRRNIVNQLVISKKENAGGNIESITHSKQDQ